MRERIELGGSGRVDPDRGRVEQFTRIDRAIRIDVEPAAQRVRAGSEIADDEAAGGIGTGRPAEHRVGGGEDLDARARCRTVADPVEDDAADRARGGLGAGGEDDVDLLPKDVAAQVTEAGEDRDAIRGVGTEPSAGFDLDGSATPAHALTAVARRDGDKGRER